MSEAFPLPAWPQRETLGLMGRYRMAPEDFRVTELPAWQASGEGEHLLCEIEKRGLNTADLAATLARRLGVAERDLGYCGAKDRHAVTRQWFSLRTPVGTSWPDDAMSGDGGAWRLLSWTRHGRKLRRGDHAGNAFALRLELAAGAALPSAERVHAHLARGLPNYFGPQRFGRDGANLARARRWAQGEARLPPRGNQRGFMLSAARSLLFNEVVAARIRSGTLEQTLPGDVLADEVPTGPLWGRGRPAATADALALETAALAPWATWCQALEHAGLNQERRPLLLVPRALQVGCEGRILQLEFTLGAGAFATSVIAALGQFVDAQRVPQAASAVGGDAGAAA